MYDGASVAVVVPAYNEEPFVGGVLESIPEFVDRVYAVDDCSTDGTWSEIQAQARPPIAVGAATDGGHGVDGRIVPIRHERNRGRGASIKTGYRRAMDDGMDVVAVMDADGQMDPNQLDRLVAPVAGGGADYAKGNRLDRVDNLGGMTVWRLFGNLLLTILTKIASGYWSMRDPQNGYTVISASALARIDIDGLYDEYGFLNDVLIELNVHDCRLVEVGMPAIYGNEESGIRYSTFIPELSKLLLLGFIRRLSRKYFTRPTRTMPALETLAPCRRVSGASRLTSTAAGRFVRKVVGGWRSLAVKIGRGWTTTPGPVTREDESVDE